MVKSVKSFRETWEGMQGPWGTERKDARFLGCPNGTADGELSALPTLTHQFYTKPILLHAHPQATCCNLQSLQQSKGFAQNCGQALCLLERKVCDVWILNEETDFSPSLSQGHKLQRGEILSFHIFSPCVFSAQYISWFWAPLWSTSLSHYR